MWWLGIIKGCDIGHPTGGELLGHTVELADCTECIAIELSAGSRRGLIRAGSRRDLIRAGSLRDLIRAGSLRDPAVLVCLALRRDRDPGTRRRHGV